MPRLPRWTAQNAERELLANGFVMVRSRGSHRVYMLGNRRVIVPFHSGDILHPKTIKEVLRALGRR